MNGYDPNSHDSKFSIILTRLDNQDEASLVHRTEIKDFMAEMRAALLLHAGKLEASDREKWYQRGFVAAITLGVSAAWAWFTNHPK